MTPAERAVSLTSFQQVALVLLRTLIGWHFLYEGLYKLRLPGWTADGQPLAAWTSAGFLRAATGPFGRLARATVDAGLLAVIDKLVMIGLLCVGVSLLLGLLTRVGCIGGMLLLALFYLMQIPTSGMPQTGAEGSYLLVNKTLIEGFAVLALFSLDTGRIAGLDRLWHERRRVSAAPLSSDPRVIEQGSGT